MGGTGDRRWQSEFARNLMLARKTATVEEAVIQLVREKLSIFRSLRPPIDLRMVASVCDIMPEIEYRPMKQDARLVPRDGHFYIEVNKNLYHRVGRRQYSIAHEIGHKILTIGKAIHLTECDAIGHATEEVEEEWLCDFAAKHLLLLTPEFIEPIIASKGLTFYAAQQILTDFKVSFEAALRTLAETTSETAAVLYCAPVTMAGLQIVRFYRSARFPVPLSRNYLIPSNSCICKSFQTDHALQSRERWNINGSGFHEFDVATLTRQIYSGGFLQDGVIALLTNIT